MLRAALPGNGPIYCDGSHTVYGSFRDHLGGSPPCRSAAALVTTHQGVAHGIRVCGGLTHLPNSHHAELVGAALATGIGAPSGRLVRSDCTSVIKKCGKNLRAVAGTSDSLLRGVFSQEASVAPLHIKAHPERHKQRSQFTEEETGIFTADLLAGNPAKFRDEGGRYIEVSVDEAVHALQAPVPSSLRENDSGAFCLDLRRHRARAIRSAYTKRRDSFRVRDDMHPREAKWLKAPFAFAVDIWKRDRASISSRASDNRILMDKFWDGRHKNFETPTDLEVQRCPNCSEEAETQGHVLLRCSHPSIVRARNAGMAKVAASLIQCYRKDAAMGKFLEGYHLLLGTTTDDAASMMTGMLTPAAMDAVLALKSPMVEGKTVYRQLVKFCKGYRNTCTDIYGARTSLLRERMEALMPVVTRHRHRIPRGHWYRPLRRGRPMVSRATDYPGLAAYDWRRTPPPGERHGIRRFFSPAPSEVARPDKKAFVEETTSSTCVQTTLPWGKSNSPEVTHLDWNAVRAIERELRPYGLSPAKPLGTSLGEWRQVGDHYRSAPRHHPSDSIVDHGGDNPPKSHMCDKSMTSLPSLPLPFPFS